MFYTHSSRQHAVWVCCPCHARKPWRAGKQCRSRTPQPPPITISTSLATLLLCLRNGRPLNPLAINADANKLLRLDTPLLCTQPLTTKHHRHSVHSALKTPCLRLDCAVPAASQALPPGAAAAPTCSPGVREAAAPAQLRSCRPAGCSSVVLSPRWHCSKAHSLQHADSSKRPAGNSLNFFSCPLPRSSAAQSPGPHHGPQHSKVQ